MPSRNEFKSCARSWPARRRRTPPSPSRAGCAPGATRRPASRSCTSPTARASIRCRWSRPNTLPNYADEVLQAHRRLRGRGDRHDRAVAGQGPAVRDAGERDRGRSAGSTIPTPTRSSPSRTRMEFLREVAHLRPRTNVIGAATRVRHTLAQAIHRFFHEHGFFWVNTPIITASDAEGAGADVPRVDARPREPAAHAGRQGRLRAGLLRRARRS